MPVSELEKNADNKMRKAKLKNKYPKGISLKAGMTSYQLWESIIEIDSYALGASCQVQSFYKSNSKTILVPKKASAKLPKPHSVQRIAVRPRQPKR